jgi:hypothetical protein
MEGGMKTQAELADIIRQLRSDLFNVEHCAESREWRTVEQESARVEQLRELRAEWDAETEALIGGYVTEVPALETMTDRAIQTTMAQDIARQIEQGSHGPEWSHR